MSGRRIAILALIGLLPIAIALVVAGVDVMQQLGRYVLANGVVAGEEVVVAAPSDGQVAEILTQAGQKVQMGQTLLRLRAADVGAQTDVVTPSDGTVLLVAVIVGQRVDSGDRLAVLDVSSRLHVIAQVDEASVSAVQPGQRADVTITALGATYQGAVREVLPAGSAAAVTGAADGTPAADGAAGGQRYPVWIDFEYGDAPIRVAMTASVRIYR